MSKIETGLTVIGIAFAIIGEVEHARVLFPIAFAFYGIAALHYLMRRWKKAR